MNDISQKIKELQEEIRKTPYHKGTEHHIGKLRAKIARLKEQQEHQASKGGGGGQGYAVSHQGDATCVLVGPPSVGKSTLLNTLTEANSPVGSYDFTTLDVIPGMMNYKGAQIQILDVPGLIGGAAKDKGDGRRILSVIRNANLVVLVADVENLQAFKKIVSELESAGIRLDKTPPQVKIKKTGRGGLKIIGDPGKIDKKTIEGIAKQFGLDNAEVYIKERLESIDQVVDAFARNRVYLPSLKVVNKIDKKEINQDDYVLISAEENKNINKLKEEIWQKLDLIRVYLKSEKSKQADFNEPLILHPGDTVLDAAKEISLELAEKVDNALLWGQHAKFPGQIVTLDYKLSDEDILYFKK
jgi:hypothetical protein